MNRLRILMGIFVVGLFATRAVSMDSAEEKKLRTDLKHAVAAENCVDVILLADTLVRGKSSKADEALYEKARCQATMGDPYLAYQTSTLIDRSKVSRSKMEALDQMLAPPGESGFSLTFAGGNTTYSGDAVFDKGTYYDVIASYYRPWTALTLGYESVAIKELIGDTYRQYHVIGVLDQNLHENFAVKIGGRYQGANYSALTTSTNYIFGIKWTADNGFFLGANDFYSSYPDNTTVGPTAVNQVTPYVGKTFGTDQASGMATVDLRGNFINLSGLKTTTAAAITALQGPPGGGPPPGGGGGAPGTTTPSGPTGGTTTTTTPTTTTTTGTTLKNSYSSVEANLRYLFDRWGLSLGYWTGQQAYAVQSDGFAVFSTSTVYTGGIKAGIDCTIVPLWTIGVNYGLSNLKNSTTNADGTSTTVGVSTSFNF